MRFLVFFLLLFLLIPIPEAHAKKPILISYGQYLSLSVEVRAKYLAEIIEALKAHESTQTFTANPGGFEGVSEALSRLVMEPAEAATADVGDVCFYAGWPTRYRRFGNKTLCSAPPEALTCQSGFIQCNEFLFGNGICVPRGNKATQFCQEKGKKPLEVASRLEGNQQFQKRWDQLKEGVENCFSGSQQSRLCEDLRARIQKLQRDIFLPQPEVATVIHPFSSIKI